MFFPHNIIKLKKRTRYMNMHARIVQRVFFSHSSSRIPRNFSADPSLKTYKFQRVFFRYESVGCVRRNNTPPEIIFPLSEYCEFWTCAAFVDQLSN